MIGSCRATQEERARTLPGDERIPRLMAVFTHGVTIDAPPEAVWPWLAQLGAGRAGWYSFDFIDNAGESSAEVIRPELQSLEPGNVLPALPGATDAFLVVEVDPPRTLVLTAPVGAEPPVVVWSFHLDPGSEGGTRLLARARGSEAWRAMAREGSSSAEPILINRIYGALSRLPTPLLVSGMEIGHGIMEGKMLRGIKRRAEGVGSATNEPGATGQSERILREAIEASGADLLDARSFWLMRPNDEERRDEPNRELALDLARRMGRRIGDRIERQGAGEPGGRP